ncbi:MULTISPECIES: methyltransferase domain-containing protein [Helicobacter]|nr:methyltransferase domain-containing protein [Helicobacter sp. UBA3407]
MKNINDYDTIKQYKELHAKSENYGTSSIAYLREVCLCIDYLKPKIVLDYGCGKGILFKALQKKYPGISFFGYDPSIPEYEILSVDKADLIINTDVLEHIPVEYLPNVVKHIASISNNCFFGLHHYAAGQILPNGENAHCTIKPASWYHMLFDKYFSDIVALKVRSQFGSVVLTFKLPPHLVAKWNQMQMSQQPSNQKFGAIHRIKNTLSYKLGKKMIDNSKNLVGWIKMPFSLYYISFAHKKSRNTYNMLLEINQELKLPKLESYADYKEALKYKEHLSFKLGQALIESQKVGGGGIIKFIFCDVPRLKREFKEKFNKPS